MKPILFSPGYALYNESPDNLSNGLGRLSDAISCEVHTENNGEYELVMEYPVDGELFDQIVDNSLIVAQNDHLKKLQPFRVYRSEALIDGVVTFYAEHDSYSLLGIPVAPYTASGVAAALAGLKSASMVTNNFTFRTDKSTSGDFALKFPASARQVLGGMEGSILDTYHGEYEFDWYTVNLWNRRGSDNGFRVTYGHNMTDYTQDRNCSECYTGAMAYYYDSVEDVCVQTSVIAASGTYDHTKIAILDFTDRYESPPTVAQLTTALQSYMSSSNIGVPKVNWTVSYAQLENTLEYKDYPLLETVGMGDTVHVYFEKYNVEAQARVVATTWDVLLEQYKEIELGSIRAKITDTINQQTEELTRTLDEETVRSISTMLTQAMMGANGGAIRFLDTNNDGDPDTLYIADNANPAQATKVWRFNYLGWAASSNGYNGPFTLGATLTDGLLANFVTAANLTAGTIQSQDGQTFVLDLDNGTLTMNGYASKTELATSGGTTINGGNITTGTLSADRINGGTFVVGGQNNSRGIIEVKDSNGVTIGTISKDALTWTGEYSASTVIGQIQDASIRIDCGQRPYFHGMIYLGLNSFTDVSTAFGTLSLGNANGEQIYLNGNTGRIDCKSLYINGQQVTP